MTITSLSNLAALLDNLYSVKFIGDDANKFEVFLAYVPVPVGNSLRDEHNIPGVNFDRFSTDADAGVTLEDILLVLQGVGMFGHPAAGLQNEAAQRKIWPFLERDQNLDGGLFP
jgi:hypothetical protein